jgi:hypothetical protein
MYAASYRRKDSRQGDVAAKEKPTRSGGNLAQTLRSTSLARDEPRICLDVAGPDWDWWALEKERLFDLKPEVTEEHCRRWALSPYV